MRKHRIGNKKYGRGKVENSNIHSNKIIVFMTLAGDFLLAMATLWVFMHHILGLALDTQLYNTFVLQSVLYLACIINGGVVLYKRSAKRFDIVMIVAKNVLLFTVLSGCVTRIGSFYPVAYKLVPLFMVSLVLVVSVFRLGVKSVVNMLYTREKHTTHAVLMGSTENNQNLYREMLAMVPFGYKVNGYFDDTPNPEFDEGCRYLGVPSSVVDYLKAHPEAKEVFCCLPSKRSEEILNVIRYCEKNFIRFYSVPNVTNYLHHRVYLGMLGTVPYLSIFNDPLALPENRLLKRLFDVAVSLLFLCTLFPIIFVVVTIVTKATMPGPIFFRQKRSGLNGQDFYCYKFRSMKVNADADRLQATKNDPRKTKWGDIMRKTNIDELPQFWNVLKGDMSLVGPRPHMLKHTEEYSQLIDKYMVRHFVKPGITGWSQVTGFRGETKELSQMEGRVRGDIWYIEHWTFALDLYIMYRTVANAIHGDKEAY